MVRTKPNVEAIKPYEPGVLKPGAIKLASNENPLGPSPKALAALRKASANVVLYPDGGNVKLKQALADHYKLSPKNFIIGNGSDEIFVFAAALTINPGDRMITSEITFSEYAFSARLFGGEPVFAPMKNGTFDLNAILGLIDDKTRWITVANPNNPTGTYVNADALKAFLQKVPDNILVLIDEAYNEYVEAPDYPDTIPLLKEFPNLFLTRTFSKIYGLAGIRLGYGIGSPELINSLSKAREPFNVNLVAQSAGIAALGDREFVEKSRKVNREGKEYLTGEFKKMGLEYYPTQGNFIFVKLPVDGTEAFQKLMELGVTVRPTRSFGVDKAIRVTIGTMKQNRFFIDCLKKAI